MLKAVLSRLFFCVPAFLGIVIVAFGIASAAGDPLEAGLVAGDGGLPRRSLDPETAERLRAELGLDRPAFLNLDVQDRTRVLEGAVDALELHWKRASGILETALTGLLPSSIPKGAPAVTDEVFGALRDRLVAAPESMTTVRDFTDQFEAQLKSRVASVVPLQAAVGATAAEVLRSRAAMVRIHRAGALALLVIGDPVPGHKTAESVADRSALKLLLELLAGCARRSGLDPSARATWRAEASKLDARAPDIVRAWIAAARAGTVPDADARAKSLEALGALAVPHLLESIFDESPEVRVRAGGFLRRYTEFTAAIPSLETPGSLGEAIATYDDRLRSFWKTRALAYQSTSAWSRAGLHSWRETRFFHWFSGVLRLDFGTSLIHERAARALIIERLPVTLLVEGTSVLLMLALSLPLGTLLARFKGRLAERLTSDVLLLFYAAPDFWVATLAIFAFHPGLPIDGLRDPEIASAIGKGLLSIWSPAALADLASHLVLPVAVLTLGGLPVFTRFVSASVLEEQRKPYVLFARSRGLPERLIFRRHVLRNALTPVVSLIGVILPALVGGSIVIERLFNIPGLGMLVHESALRSDVPVAMGVVIVTALFALAGHLLADLFLFWSDRRVRFS